MQTTPQTNQPIMRVLPATKLRINLSELRFLEQAVEDTAVGEKADAIQGIVSYAKLALGICLKDEAVALHYKLHNAPAVVQLTLSATL